MTVNGCFCMFVDGFNQHSNKCTQKRIKRFMEVKSWSTPIIKTWIFLSSTVSSIHTLCLISGVRCINPATIQWKQCQRRRLDVKFWFLDRKFAVDGSRLDGPRHFYSPLSFCNRIESHMLIIFGTGSQLSDDINLGIRLRIGLLTQHMCEFPDNVINLVQWLQCYD